MLLILAGVSITMLTGQNGIINRAQEAKTKTGAANEKEAVNLQENDHGYIKEQKEIIQLQK